MYSQSSIAVGMQGASKAMSAINKVRFANEFYAYGMLFLGEDFF